MGLDMRLRGNKIKNEDAYAIWYIKMFIGGYNANSNIKHLVVDEVQEYSALQLKIIDMLYPAQYCGLCHQYRPPRSYHCKRCGTCILKRDHHCPWVGQCVGFGNHKYFIQFLVYTSIAICFSVGWHIFGFIRDYDSSIPFSSQFASTKLDIFRLVTFFMDLAVAFSVSMLCFTHVYSMVINTTGQENMELQTLRYKKVTKRKTSMYCKSAKTNFLEIMGNTWIDWFFPTKIEGDGLSFIKVIDPTE